MRNDADGSGVYLLMKHYIVITRPCLKAHLEDLVRKLLWVRRGEADAHLWVNTGHSIQQLGKGHCSTALGLVHALETLQPPQRL